MESECFRYSYYSNTRNGEKEMRDKKVLTITIPAYNVEKYLPEIMPNYLDKRVIDRIEILIINDGSTDHTAYIAEQYQNNFPRSVRLINKENGGHGSTVNRGIAEATGKYFKVIDGDDWVDTEALIKLVNQLEEVDCDLIINPFVKVNIDDGTRTIVKTNSLTPGHDYCFDKTVFQLSDILQLHSCTYKTDLLKMMRTIDENCFYVDQEYVLYPIDKVRNIIYYDYPVYQYRVGNINQSMSFFNMQKNRHMHERVIMSLVTFIGEMPHTDNVRRFLQNRVQKMCQLQIDIYMSMEMSDDVKDELMSFLRKIKMENREIYYNIPGKKALCLRILGGGGYRIIKRIKGVN